MSEISAAAVRLPLVCRRETSVGWAGGIWKDNEVTRAGSISSIDDMGARTLSLVCVTLIAIRHLRVLL